MSAIYGGGAGRSYGSAVGLDDPLPPRSLEHSILRSGGLGDGERPKAARVGVFQLVFVPWLCLLLTLICCLLAGSGGESPALWAVPLLLLGCTAAFSHSHYKSGNNAQAIMGLLSVTATLIGLAAGAYAAAKFLGEYRRLSAGASYFNVLPTEPAAGHADGATFVFTNDSMVDLSRAFGYTDIYSPAATLYCVAPIVDKAGLQRIQFWAAGTNCCHQRGGFTCGDVLKPGSRGALMQPRAAQRSPGFRAAVSGAESAYGLEAADGGLLLSWKVDPVAYRDGLWRSTLTLMLVLSGVYFAISVMVGFSLISFVNVNVNAK